MTNESEKVYRMSFIRGLEGGLGFNSEDAPKVRAGETYIPDIGCSFNYTRIEEISARLSIIDSEGKYKLDDKEGFVFNDGIIYFNKLDEEDMVTLTPAQFIENNRPYEFKRITKDEFIESFD